MRNLVLAGLGLTAVQGLNFPPANCAEVAVLFTDGCKYLQIDHTDTTTDCYIACSDQTDQMCKLFDLANYPNNAFDIGTAYNLSNVLLIKVMTTYTDCRLTDYYNLVNQKMSQWGPLAGSLFKTGYESFFGQSELREGLQFLTNAFGSGTYGDLGAGANELISTIFEFKAPRIIDFQNVTRY